MQTKCNNAALYPVANVATSPARNMQFNLTVIFLWLDDVVS